MSDPAIHPLLQADPERDSDPQESAEWREALASVLHSAGPQRARELMDLLAGIARDPSVGWQPALDLQTAIARLAADEPPFSALAATVGSKGYHRED